MANVGVIGAGSWGTALSVLLADNGHHVTIWSIDEKEVEMLDKKREHLTKLPGVKLSDGMTITSFRTISVQQGVICCMILKKSEKIFSGTKKARTKHIVCTSY